MTSKRDIERRLENLEEDEDPEEPQTLAEILAEVTQEDGE